MLKVKLIFDKMSLSKLFVGERCRNVDWTTEKWAAALGRHLAALFQCTF